MMKQKNFKEIYDAIYARCGQSMEVKRKTALKKSIIAFIVAIIVWVALISSLGFMLAPLFIIIFVITILILIIVISKINKNYKRSFKEQIINEIVEESNPDLNYYYNNGVSEGEYAESKFDWGWDRYHSEDLIEGKLEDGSILKMSQVHTEEEHETTDSDGHTSRTYVTTFLGLYGIIKLNTFTSADFMIKNNSKLSKFNKKRIEMESSEFEKYYDVYTCSEKDAVLRQNTMEILTPETIEKFVIIRNLFKRSINVRVFKNKIFFRIEVGDIFEPPTFKSSVNFEMLRRYFLIIDVPRMIYEAMIDNIILMYGDSEARENRTIANMTDEQKQDYLEEKRKAEESSYFSHN